MSHANLPQLGEEGRILEGVVTTMNADGSVNISPMGPIVDPELATLILRPYRSSTTYENLNREKVGVFHVTDDVLLIAQAAVGTPDPPPQTVQAQQISGQVLKNACRWVEFEVLSIDERGERAMFVARAVAHHRNRDFFGFNRAQHAVIEAAILATRLELLPLQQIRDEFDRLEPLVKKTGGRRELEAFEHLRDNVVRRISSS